MTSETLGVVVGAITYVMFPEQAFFTAVCAVGGAILLDLFTRLWAVKKTGGRIWSKRIWDGTKIKLYSYMVVFILTGLSYRVAPVAQASVFLATVVYSIIFLREAQSIVENLCDAGADLGWLVKVVKKKQRDILEEEE